MEYTLEKLEVYQLAEAFSDIIWEIVVSGIISIKILLVNRLFDRQILLRQI